LIRREPLVVVFERTHSPLSVMDIRRVERRLGVPLPQDLKEHYLCTTVADLVLVFS
jgi:hypothetical protein